MSRFVEGFAGELELLFEKRADGVGNVVGASGGLSVAGMMSRAKPPAPPEPSPRNALQRVRTSGDRNSLQRVRQTPPPGRNALQRVRAGSSGDPQSGMQTSFTPNGPQFNPYD